MTNIYKRFGFSSLLAAPNANPKLAKSLKLNVLTAPLHLAPASLSGWNVCPMATQGCKAACLHTAGNPAYMKGKAKARNARTRAYFEARPQFMHALALEIERHVKKAKALGYHPAVRLNATSDIRWEVVPVVYNGKTFANIMAAFPDVQFYDYTKLANRRNLPSNYHLTFSLAENNDAQAVQAWRNGMNVAAVFNVIRGHELPRAYTLGEFIIPVIDGDEHDYRPSDAKLSIVGLRAKGDARKDTSGFVRSIKVS